MKKIIKKIARIIVLAEVITFSYINKVLAVVASSNSVNTFDISSFSNKDETAYGAVPATPSIKTALIKLGTYLLIWIAVPSIIALIITKHKNMKPRNIKILKVIMYIAIFGPFIYFIIYSIH